MAIMTPEERESVPGGIWSVVGNTGLVSECRTQEQAFSEIQQLSKTKPEGGPYTAVRGYQDRRKSEPILEKIKQVEEVAVDNRTKLEKITEIEARLLPELQAISQCRTTQEPRKVVIEKLQEELKKVEERENNES